MGKATRDVHPLLFAAREGGGRKRPKPLGGDVQLRQQGARLVAGLINRRAYRQQGGLGHHVQRRHSGGHHAQELTDIAQRLAPERQDLAWLGSGDIQVTHPYVTLFRQIVTVDHAHQGRFARPPGRTSQRHTFAGCNSQVGTLHHGGDHSCALIMQGKAFAKVFDTDHGHTCKTEETRSWV